jgi:hypothetical protein
VPQELQTLNFTQAMSGAGLDSKDRVVLLFLVGKAEEGHRFLRSQTMVCTFKSVAWQSLEQQ